MLEKKEAVLNHPQSPLANVGGDFLNDPAMANDTLQLSLGKDAGIVVKRDQLKDFCKAGVLGGKKTITKAFEYLATKCDSLIDDCHAQSERCCRRCGSDSRGPATNDYEIMVSVHHLAEVHFT